MMCWRNNICVGELLCLWKSVATSYKKPYFLPYFSAWVCCGAEVYRAWAEWGVFGPIFNVWVHILKRKSFNVWVHVCFQDEHMNYELLSMSLGLWLLYGPVIVGSYTYLRWDWRLRWLWRLFEDWRLVEDWYAFWSVWTIDVTEIEEMPEWSCVELNVLIEAVWREIFTPLPIAWS